MSFVVRFGKCHPSPTPSFILEIAADKVSVVFSVAQSGQGSRCCETVPWACRAGRGHADGGWQLVA